MKVSSIFLLMLNIVYQTVISQSLDTNTHQSYLPEIQIVGKTSQNDYQQLPEIVGTSIYAGRKNSLVVMENVLGNKSTNTMRQVLAKVPGVHIWESDGSGIQIGIASRGLSPNRSWEFNVKQNGYDIAADPFGYPEAYYNPQLQAVQRMEIVRGSASLQYGPQIGGLINYIMKDGSQLTKKFNFESEQTLGSYGLISSFNAIGGNAKRINYYAFYDARQANGFRENSKYNTNTYFGVFTFKFSENTNIKAEFTKWNMLSQQPGGLLDTQIESNPRQSFRSRNWFNLDWSIAALTFTHSWNEKNKLMAKAFYMDADRHSIGFNPSGGIIVQDTFNKQINSFNSRNIDSDRYRNAGLEVKWLSDFQILNKNHTFSAGIRLYNGNTNRYRSGVEKGGGNNFTLVRNENIPWNGIIQYNTNNAAFYSESVLRVGKKLLIIPGIRIEYLDGTAKGNNGIKDNLPIPLIPRSKERVFAIAGIAAEYHLKELEIYGNINQSYRPIQFADLTTPPTTDELDPNLKDSKAVNIDLGIRGFVTHGMRVDLSIYNLRYENRIGTLIQQRINGSFYNFRTNIGTSRSYGLESLIEWNISKQIKENTAIEIIPFAAYSYNHASYKELHAVTQSGTSLTDKIIKGNKVENAPEHILRSGLEIRNDRWRILGNYSYVSSSFTDANNTIVPSSNAQNGLIPSYQIIDLSMQYKISQLLHLKFGINNLSNANYFTRRASGYPGPGALPADGRSFWMGISIKI